jgi:hypothetical protein
MILQEQYGLLCNLVKEVTANIIRFPSE